MEHCVMALTFVAWGQPSGDRNSDEKNLSKAAENGQKTVISGVLNGQKAGWRANLPALTG
jgi:hypothetical protein